MNGPDRKPMHAELTIRGTTLMLRPEMPAMGARSAKTVGSSPTTLYLLVENVDKQGSGESGEARREASGAGIGHVLGRPLRTARRSGGLHLVHSNAYCRPYACPNE